MDNLEIATGSDNDEENAPPPLPRRTTSALPTGERPLPTPPSDSKEPGSNSDPSDPTSSDVSQIDEDTSSDTDDSDADENESKNFDANSSLPPVPNGTLDLSKPSDKQLFSSEDERYANLVKILKI